jgi:hypothetical protein
MEAVSPALREIPTVGNREGESENISAGGIAFHTKEKLFPGDILELKIMLTDAEIPLETIGRVLRAAQISSKNHSDDGLSYQVAVSFLAIHSFDRVRIENFCKKFEVNS